MPAKYSFLVPSVLILAACGGGPTKVGDPCKIEADDCPDGLVCAEPAGGAATCQLAPVELAVETFNVALAGAFLPYEADRRQPIADALAADDADLICIQEAWRQSDKDLIAAAVASSLPHVVSFEHDWSTAIDDPTDQNGMVPPAFTTPPCGDPMIAAAMDAAIDCLVQNCSTIPGSDQGQTTSTDCAANSCTPVAAALLTGPADYQRCYGCLAPQLPTEKLADIRDTCINDVDAGLAFGGQNGVMILSRHPLEGAEVRVLPGTWNRRVILHATAQVPGTAPVDVYCNHLTPVFSSFTLPYTGQYGNGLFGAEGWAAEQLLQTQKLNAMVDERTGTGPALILGDFNASSQYVDEMGIPFIAAEGPQTKTLLDETYVEAVTADYAPQCTYCGDNLVNGDSNDEWIDHIYLLGLDAAAVAASSRIFVDRVVSTTDAMGMPLTVELSDHYGMRAALLLAPQ